MPGMLAGPVRERQKFYNRAFISNWSDFNAANDAADQIIESPDRFLLTQDEVFEAEGGWSTFGLTMGMAGAGAAALFIAMPSMAAHFGRGQLKAVEWALLGGATFAGGFIGNQVGIQTLGDAQRYNNHWMAYAYIKSQNRFTRGTTLRNTPMFY